MVHELKTHPKPFRDVKTGLKTFEIRFNDRNYQVNDELLLNEYLPADYYEEGDPEQFAGEFCHRRVTYILTGGQYGIEAGFVVLGIERI